MTKKISLDQPLLEQTAVREILFPEKEGLIPNLTLQRLLEVTRILIQNQLKKKFPNYKLANLVIGYDVFLQKEDGGEFEETSQRFSIEWNEPTVNESSVNSLSLKELGDSVSKALQLLLLELVSKLLNNRKASIYLSFTVTQLINIPSSSTKPTEKPSDSSPLESSGLTDNGVLEIPNFNASYTRVCAIPRGGSFRQWIENGIPTGIACPP